MAVVAVTQDIRAFVEKITIQPNDVLVVTVKERLSLAALHKVQESLSELGSKARAVGAIVLVVEDGIDLKHLPEDEMRRHGWVRAETPLVR